MQASRVSHVKIHSQAVGEQKYDFWLELYRTRHIGDSKGHRGESQDVWEVLGSQPG